ncbi:MAG TPA: T9SS type A sorting domain-containing protein, partial [Aquaticitalea sp.]|nr:T9SS type A sorting domain-containing protein [Aquaticitalea sp.]
TGSGGTCQSWYVINGNFNSISDTNPNCALTVDEAENSLVTVYPNPFSDQIQILSLSQNLDITMYDMLGKQIAVSLAADGTIDTRHLSSGLYVLKVASERSYKTFRLIKE